MQFIFHLSKCFVTNYGLFGGIVHGQSGIITPRSEVTEVSPQLQKHSNSHFDTDPSPVNCSRLFEMLDLLRISLWTQWSICFAGRFNRFLKRCEMVPGYFWLTGLSGSRWRLNKRAEGLMKGCCHFTGGEQTKSEACKVMCWGQVLEQLWALCRGISGKKWSTTTTTSRQEVSRFWTTHWQMWHKTLWRSRQKDAVGYRVVLLLSCSTLYCLLRDLQHLHVALQVGQRQGRLNALWPQLKIFYQRLKWTQKWEDKVSERETKEVKEAILERTRDGKSPVNPHRRQGQVS